METMTALVRIAGDLNMTVPVHDVTPAEALLLMHIHDPDTRDVFEGATKSGDVKRSRTDERERLRGKYTEQAKLIDRLFPGRNAADIPDSFADLEDVPLELVHKAREEQAIERDQEAVKQTKPKGGFAGLPSKNKKQDPAGLQDVIG